MAFLTDKACARLSWLIIRSAVPLFLTADFKMIYRILLLIAFNGVTNAQTNILHNADFESADFNGNWYAIGCHMERSNDAYHGQHSVHISNRYILSMCVLFKMFLLMIQ